MFRVLHRFNITGRGTVYMLSINKDSSLCIGDILFDLRGNRFKVAGIEMLRRLMGSEESESQGIIFDLLDGVEIEGNILVRNIYDINFLFCNHPLYPRRVDEDYEEEYQAAGLHHPCALFSYEDMENGKLTLYGEQLQGLTIYRGWMMKPEMYRVFYKALEDRGIVLINSPEEYERYHLLPGWYEDFKDITMESTWITEGNVDRLMSIAKFFSGSYIVKDYVKSRKHEWYDACYIPDISNDINTRRIIGNFVERQGDSLTGGIVLRKFVDLNQIGYHEQSGMPIAEEYRAFVYAGKVMILDNYWNNDQEAIISDDEYEWIESICKRIKSNFVTLDLARKADGELIVMELGDGQVSGLQQIKAEWFYNKFPYTIDIEELLEDKIVVMASEPIPNVSVENICDLIKDIETAQQMVDIYANIHNKYWFLLGRTFAYKENDLEYDKALERAEGWKAVMETLEIKIIEFAIKEKLLKEENNKSGLMKRLEPFMNTHGYMDGGGWWIKGDGKHAN